MYQQGSLLFVLALLLTSFNLHAEVNSPYQTVDSYLAENPAQIPLMEQFSLQVAAEPIAIVPDQIKRPLRIAATYPGVQQSDYWRRNIKALTRRLALLEIDFELTDLPYRVNADIEEIRQNVDHALATDPDYLIMTLENKQERDLAEEVLAADSTQLILLNITTPVKNWRSRQPMIYVGFDHATGSRLMVEHIKSNNPLPLNVGVLFRAPGYISQMRGGVFIDSTKSPDLQLKSAFYTQSDTKTAREAALKMLDQDPDIDWILSCSTDVALGAIEAIQSLGLEHQTRVNGWGGGQSELDAIRQGSLALTVMRMNDDSGVAIAEAIKNRELNRPVPQIHSGRFVLIDNNMSAQQISQASAQAFRYSN
jgi:autoinducer 2-binding protein LuxP